jgi:thymidylate kinase
MALVGGDGAGKSTAVGEVRAWLAQNFDTMKVHLGKPPESVISLGTAVLLRMTRWSRSRVTGVGPAGPEAGVAGYLWLFRRVCLARRRYLVYARARRFATNGGLVITDRYPIPGLQLMDGPQAAAIVGAAPRNRLVGWLAAREAGYYRRIMPPDLLVVLRVDPEIAVQRKREEVPASVRARNREVWEFDWDVSRGRVVDASESAPDVLARVKSLIWASL